MSSGYEILSLDEAETAQHRGSTLIPIRHLLGFQPAGINAWKADTGGQLIPPHEEDSGNEELYAVKKQNVGHVVSIAATLADQPSASVPALTAVLSKSTIQAASKALALEYAAHQIRFNTVSPGIISTPMHAGGNRQMLAEFHPLARMGEIADIVGAVLYLQEATFVTGENIHVDGGVHAGRP